MVECTAAAFITAGLTTVAITTVAPMPIAEALGIRVLPWVQPLSAPPSPRRAITIAPRADMTRIRPAIEF